MLVEKASVPHESLTITTAAHLMPYHLLMDAMRNNPSIFVAVLTQIVMFPLSEATCGPTTQTCQGTLLAANVCKEYPDRHTMQKVRE